MSSWLFALQLVPLVTNLIATAEKILGEREGVKKKQFVMDGIRQVVKAMISLTTGNTKVSLQAIETYMTPISGLIDVVVSLMFPHEE